MKFLLHLVALMVFATPTKADNLSPRAFTAMAVAVARTTLPTATVTVTGDLQLQTRSASGKTAGTDLGNAYELYRRDPTKIDDVIRRYIGVLAETVRLADAKAVVDRSRIIPVLKSRLWLEGIRTPPGAAGAPELLTEPFNTELTIVYAEDRPQSMHYLMAGDDVGDRAKLHDVALENLGKLLPKVEMRAGPDGIWQVSAGGDYEASLLVADRIWSSGQIKVDGEIVVAVPGKGALFITGSLNRAGITRLRALAVDLAKGPYALTPALFVYRRGKFVTFEVAE